MRLNKKAAPPGGDDGYLLPVDSRDVKGVYSNFPAYTPKYLSTNGRDYVRELTVARLYLSGGAYETLPGVAPWFSVNSYVGFFLQEVTERNAEKSQIIPMNGDGYAAFFSGREPRVYSFSGVVLNTQQDQWRSTLTNLYEEVFRGSKVSGMNRVVQIAYDDKVVSGSMMNMTQVISSAPDETFAKFAFDILVVAVYDAWMESDDDFTAAGSAFLGDKTIFPDMARSQTKKNLRDYVKSQYIALPPAVKPKGAAGVKCDLYKITVNPNGTRIDTENSVPTTALPKECLDAKTITAVHAEMIALEKKYKTDSSDISMFSDSDRSRYEKLDRTSAILLTHQRMREEEAKYEQKVVMSAGLRPAATAAVQFEMSVSEEDAGRIIDTPQGRAILYKHGYTNEMVMAAQTPTKPVNDLYANTPRPPTPEIQPPANRSVDRGFSSASDELSLVSE